MFWVRVIKLDVVADKNINVQRMNNKNMRGSL